MLIADDEPDMRVLIGHVLRAAGADVVAEATTSREAVDLWREHRPEVIVLDQRIPPSTGIEVASAIVGEDPSVVILLFSAAVDNEIRTAAARAGIAECVSKENVFDIPAIAQRHLAGR